MNSKNRDVEDIMSKIEFAKIIPSSNYVSNCYQLMAPEVKVIV
jgi:hypothetical protein